MENAILKFSLIATIPTSLVFKAHTTQIRHTTLISPLLFTRTRFLVLEKGPRVYGSAHANKFTLALHLVITPFTLIAVSACPPADTVPAAHTSRSRGWQPILVKIGALIKTAIRPGVSPPPTKNALKEDAFKTVSVSVPSLRLSAQKLRFKLA